MSNAMYRSLEEVEKKLRLKVQLGNISFQILSYICLRFERGAKLRQLFLFYLLQVFG